MSYWATTYCRAGHSLEKKCPQVYSCFDDHEELDIVYERPIRTADFSKSMILFLSLNNQCRLYQHRINHGVGEGRVKGRKLICNFIILLKVDLANGICVLAVCLWVSVCACVGVG